MSTVLLTFDCWQHFFGSCWRCLKCALVTALGLRVDWVVFIQLRLSLFLTLALWLTSVFTLVALLTVHGTWVIECCSIQRNITRVIGRSDGDASWPDQLGKHLLHERHCSVSESSTWTEGGSEEVSSARCCCTLGCVMSESLSECVLGWAQEAHRMLVCDSVRVSLLNCRLAWVHESLRMWQCVWLRHWFRLWACNL